MVLKARAPQTLGLAVLALGLVVAPVRGQEARPRVAVVELEPTGLREGEAGAATDRLRSELVNLHVFTVLDRAQTEAILDELAFQQEGIADPSQAVTLGKLLSVEYIVTGRLIRLQGGYQIHAQMIDVASGEIVRGETAFHRGDFIGLLSGPVPQVAARLAQVEPRPPPAAAPQPEHSPRAAAAPRSAWVGMGMMGDSRRSWALMMGGMMLVAAAVMSSRDDGEHGGGHRPEAALAMGAIGIGLVTYSLWPVDSPSAVHRPWNRTDPEGSGLLVAQRRPNPNIALGWRWRW